MFTRILKPILLLTAVTMAVPTMACTYTFGRYTVDPKQYEQNWPMSPLHQALTEATQCEVNLKVYSAENELFQAVVKQEVDLAYLKDFAYYLAVKKNPDIKPIAVSLSYSAKDQNGVQKKLLPYYTGYIVSLNSNSQINNVNDLNGKKFGFLSPNSTSGYVLPIAFLDDNKITLASSTFYYDESKLYQELENGREDAIAVWDYVLLKNKANEVKILKQFDYIPNPAIVMTHKLPAEMVSLMQKNLIAIKPKGDELLPVEGYQRLSVNMYQQLFKSFDQFCKNNPDSCEIKANK